MTGKHFAEEPKVKNKNRVVLYCVLFVLVCVIGFTGFKVTNWIIENTNSEKIRNKLNEAVMIDDSTEKNGDENNTGNSNDAKKYNVDFKKIKESNPDAIAWFKVNGTNIEYPIVKTSDNDYYMEHSFDNNYNSAGWVFMDYRNEFDGKDKNMVVYGHNRRDGSMFGTLKNILSEEWQNNKKNLLIPFISENEKTMFYVFSVYRIEKEDYYITTDFQTVNDFQVFIDTIKGRSMKDFGVDVNVDDQILTLSTCADDDRYRVVLHAKKIK